MTIFVTIFDSTIATNILRTDVIPTILKNSDARIVVMTEGERIPEYRALFPENRVVFEGVRVDPMSKLEHRWVSFLWHTVSSETLAIQLYGGPIAPKRGFINRIATHVMRTLFGNRLSRTFFHAIDIWLFQSEPYAALFERYTPALVCAGNVYAPLDVELLREAKRRRIPSIGMVKSWDNVTSRGIIRQLPDRFVVQTKRVASELQQYADVKARRITVAGVPQYDVYFRPDDSERIAFWKHFGIDGTRKVILYLEPGTKLAPRGHDVWPIIDDAIDQNRICMPVDVFLSIHPAYGIKEGSADHLRHIKVVRFGYWLRDDNSKTWELSKDASLDLMRAVKHSDLVITTASTMNIESSIFDKPIINIAFDGNRSLPYQDSVRQYYDYTHLLPIVQSGGVKIAYSPEELLKEINFLLAHPEWGREGRKRIVDEQCVYSDGKSAERIGEAILAFARSDAR